MGTFTSHAKGFGFVSVEGQEEDFFIAPEDTGDAFLGDLVEVALKGKSAGKRQEGVVVKVLAGLILSRGLSYYTELLISAVMTVAAQLFLGNEKEHREKISEKLKTIQEKGKGYERKRGNS